MNKIEDFMYDYEGFWKNSPGKCRIRIFKDDSERYIGICTALSENLGTSTTNRIEYIYADIKEQLFPNQPDNQLINSSTVTAIESFVKDNKTSKPWAIAGTLILKGWEYYIKINEKKTDSTNGDEKRLLWIDHWPKGIGFRQFEHEFAVVKFTSTLEPVWHHMTESDFEKYTGVDIRWLEPLELLEPEA